MGEFSTYGEYNYVVEQLCKAESSGKAHELIKGYSRTQLLGLCSVLSCRPTRTNMESMRDSIVRNTYSAYKRSHVIRNTKLK